MKKVRFRRRTYNLFITDHAKTRMEMRSISKIELQKVIETGTVKPKTFKNKFWVFKKMKSRKDNFICASVSIEHPNLVVITTLINWRPK